MNAAHLHLLLNHFPVILLIVGFVILIVGLIAKKKTLKITALVIFMCGSLITIPTYFSGGNAEDIIEDISPESKVYIEKHEDQAKIFSITFYMLGILSFIGILGISKDQKYASWFTYLILIFSAISLYFAALTGNSGGEIRHTEIRKEIPTNGIEREKIEVDH
ncbi:MAG: hypothetical protein N2319_11440 [Candidatus Kapabacteria bacterium]|nr:hypothetical protein [Candidatus Kapabacteria bacterium]